MKVNTALLNMDDGNDVKTKPNTAVKDVKTRPDAAESKASPGKHSGVKTVLLIIAMIGGFILFAWNMINYVNNMRLDGQGRAISIVSEMDKTGSIDSFMDTDKTDASTEQNNTGNGDTDPIPSDAGDDMGFTEIPLNSLGTDIGQDDDKADIGQDGDIDMPDDAASLKQIAIDAKNEAALVRQELKNAEDMLNASLQREAELKSQLEGNGKTKN